VFQKVAQAHHGLLDARMLDDVVLTRAEAWRESAFPFWKYLTARNCISQKVCEIKWLREAREPLRLPFFFAMAL